MNYKISTCVLLSVLCVGSIQLHAQKNLQLQYTSPATVWEETLPLGNGRLGMTPNSNPIIEKIVLNDITLWSGSVQDANNYEAHKSLPEIRELILAGKNDEAQDLVNRNFVCLGPGSGGPKWGKFQTLGALYLEQSYPETVGTPKVENYKRSLDLNQAVATASYTVDGVKYTRAYFSSFADDVNVIRLVADKKGKLNINIKMDRPERFNVQLDGADLEMYGQLDNGTDGKGMQYSSRVRVLVRDGQLKAVAPNKDQPASLSVEHASEILIFVAAATDFRSADFKNEIQQVLDQVTKKDYAKQRKEHIQKFSSLFARVSLDLGKGKDDWTTKDRLDSYYNKPTEDLSLAALFFQYARYLSISSTRIGLLPPNLQGLWAHEIHTAWNGDYHLDVNVQMNHWHLGLANLSELNLPLVDLVKGLVEPGERTAKAYYNARGWIAHVITNVWGYTEPGESASWGASNAGSGWLCNNLWEHYMYTEDDNYLKDIYPVLKGAALFYSDALVFDPKTGWLVTSPSVSPENTFIMPNGRHASISMGPTIDNQIVRELFSNVIFASKRLGLDADFAHTLEDKLKQIPPAARIAKDGRIMEWLEEYQEEDPQHRHISHLYGVYPASLITPTSSPEWAEAAKKTLAVKGDDGPGWAIAYKQLFWARLHDGNRAFKLLNAILKPTVNTEINYGAGGGVYYNLLSAGPPFQIDGNFGAAAGIGEMLLQSHDAYIQLLPAIPDAWMAHGEVKGVKAKGNITVDFKWKNGKVTTYKLRSIDGRDVQLMVNGSLKTVKTTKI